MEEMHDVIIGVDAVNILSIEIQNRQGQRQGLREQIISLDGQIAGLREACRKIEKMQGHCVALPKT